MSAYVIEVRGISSSNEVEFLLLVNDRKLISAGLVNKVALWAK